jgi:hypothetical protein
MTDSFNDIRQKIVSQAIEDLKDYYTSMKEVPSLDEIKILRQIILHLQALRVINN